METLEELKEIIAGKPEDATHIDDDGDYIRYELGKKRRLSTAVMLTDGGKLILVVLI